MKDERERSKQQTREAVTATRTEMKDYIQELRQVHVHVYQIIRLRCFILPDDQASVFSQGFYDMSETTWLPDFSSQLTCLHENTMVWDLF